MDTQYPRLPPGENIVPDDKIDWIKKRVYPRWQKWMKYITPLSKRDDKYSRTFELSKQADDFFKKLMRTKNIKDWISLNKRLDDAENSLYGFKR